MDDKKFKTLINELKQINTQLNFIVRFMKITTPKPSIGSEEKKILKLCNQKNTIDDMINLTGKKRNNIKVILTHLRNKGMIESEKAKGKLVYRTIR